MLAYININQEQQMDSGRVKKQYKWQIKKLLGGHTRLDKREEHWNTWQT
jgi:hypothetical protein